MNTKIIGILIAVVLVMVTGYLVLEKIDSGKHQTVTVVWYPNESGEEYRGTREALSDLITQTIGRPVEHKLTTDYAIAIEALANNNAHISFLGAEGYVQAHRRNPDVIPFVVHSGASGTSEDAVYYSWLAVPKGKESQYQSSGGYSLDNIKGKRFSFVSNSSTSGFKVPSSVILAHFKKTPEFVNIEVNDLLEGGAGKLFAQVLFGGSHQGALINILTDRADIAALADTVVGRYMNLISGVANRPGAHYIIRPDAEEPFNAHPGKELVLIGSAPVLNAPFVINQKLFTAEEIGKLRTAMTSDAVANDPRFFAPKGSSIKGLFPKESEQKRFVVVEDSWFDPVRELGK